MKSAKLPKAAEKPPLAKLVTHNLARSGSLRRRLAIPNPFHYQLLSRFTTNHWQDLKGLANRSPFSLTTPKETFAKRAIVRTTSLTMRPAKRARLRSYSRYILQADISRFYHSIYSHSIPWAIHTKEIAKKDRSLALIGNELDRLIKNSQDGQTLGIPIGPDISLLIAEIILGAVDEKIAANNIRNGFRFIDDYELGFQTSAEAESALGIIQSELNEYELALNERKTTILKLPISIDNSAISELRVFPFRKPSKPQRSDLIRYFDMAFEFARSQPDEGILKYAVSRMKGETVTRPNWKLYQDLLLQCAVVEPGALPFVLNQFIEYKDSYPLNAERMEKSLNEIIRYHAPLGHASEVAWGIWGLILIQVQLSNEVAQQVAKMEDSVVALLTLHANSLNLIGGSINFDNYMAFMNRQELYGDQWLLAYEANVKGWLPSADPKGHVDSDELFSILKKNDVSFYNEDIANELLYDPSADAYTSTAED